MTKTLNKLGLLAAIAPYIILKFLHYVVVNSSTTGVHSLWALVWTCLYAILGWQAAKMMLPIITGKQVATGINLDVGTFYGLTLGTTGVQLFDDFMHNSTATGLDSIWRLAMLLLGAFIVFFLARDVWSALGEMNKSPDRAA